MLVFATLAQAWSWLGAYARILSFGHGVFFGIGAYAVAVSNVRGGSPWYGALGGALCAVVVASLCGVLALHGRGYFFSAVTLGAGILAVPFVAARHWVGPGNAIAFARHPGFLNLQFTHSWPYALLAALVFGAAQGLTYALRSSRIGYSLRALRSNALAARSVGIAARPAQLIVLAVSAFVTSVAGSFVAEYGLGTDPHAAFGLALPLDVALAATIAGPRLAWGAALVGMIFAVVTRVFEIHPAGTLGAVELAGEGMLVVTLALLRPDGLSIHRRGSARAGLASTA